MSSLFDYKIEIGIETRISTLCISNYGNMVILKKDFIETAIMDIYDKSEIKYGVLKIYIDDELWITTEYQMFGYHKILLGCYESEIKNTVYHELFK